MKLNIAVGLLVIFSVLFSPVVFSKEQLINGKWVFEKSIDYSNPKKNFAVQKLKYLDILKSETAFQASCTVRFSAEAYSPTKIFARLISAGENVDDIFHNLEEIFSINLSGTKAIYSVGRLDCAKSLGVYVLVTKGDLVFFSDAIFHHYKKVVNGGNLRGYKITSLPFNGNNYMELCELQFDKNWIPQSKNKCAPVYYPYVFSKSSVDEISKLVGSHNYISGNSRATSDDYNAPGDNGLHPVFLIFPMFNDITVIRVDDFESRNEARTRYFGTYLTIKDGMVVDQLDARCHLSEKYFCVDDEGKPYYKLMENGKFREVN